MQVKWGYSEHLLLHLIWPAIPSWLSSRWLLHHFLFTIHIPGHCMYVHCNWRCKVTTQNWQICYIQSTESSPWKKHIHTVAVPANTTNRLQSLDVSADTAAKDFLRPGQVQWMVYWEGCSGDGCMVDMQPLVLKPISMHWTIEFLDYKKAHTDITEWIPAMFLTNIIDAPHQLCPHFLLNEMVDCLLN